MAADRDRARVLYDANRHVTINGQPARISGWASAFASVRSADMAGPQGEWSWHAVAAILGTGGEFSL